MMIGVAIISIVFFLFAVHSVPEGHVAVYFLGGALQPYVNDPGVHFKIPLITWHEIIAINLQTDAVFKIPCGTSNGVMIYFDKAEVVNRLKKPFVLETIRNYTSAYDKMWIFDKIHHEINQFCSSHTLQEVYVTQFDQIDDHLSRSLQLSCDTWAPGIEIISVRVTKPIIPDSIKENFVMIESEKAKRQIAEETQKVSTTLAETRKIEATIKADQELEVAKIDYKKQVAESEAKRDIQAVQDSVHLAREKALTDAEFYRLQKQADAHSSLLTPEFLKYTELNGIAKVDKVYFGEHIPTFLGDVSVNKK
jgi:regulator of protease activity HflC (stomatin/prohibitin superfamily)